MENRKHLAAAKSTLIQQDTEKSLLRIVISDTPTAESNIPQLDHSRQVHFSPDSENLHSGSDKRQNHHQDENANNKVETRDYLNVNCTSMPNSPSSSPRSRSPRAPSSKSPDNSKKTLGEKVFDFRIVENCGSGNCLFYTIDEFLHSHGRHCPHGDFISNEEELRREIVAFIIKPDKPKQKTTRGKKGEEKLVAGAVSGSGKSYSNWVKLRRDIKLNLEDHMPFFRHYDPDGADEEQDETARQVYKHYMNQSGTYGTCAELYAAMEMYSFGATIIAKDSRACDKYVVYHLDMNCSEAKHIRKPRIYIHFQGSPSQGHFELLDPITVFRPYHPCPLPSGQYKVRERNYRDRYFRLIPAKSTFKSNNDENWMSFWRSLHSWKRENNPLHRKRKHEDSLKEKNDDGQEEEQNLPNCNKSDEESCKKIKSGKSRAPDSLDSPDSKIQKETVGVGENFDSEEGLNINQNNHNDDSIDLEAKSESESKSNISDNASDIDSGNCSNSNEKSEPDEEEPDSPDFLFVDFETYPKIEGKETIVENDEPENENDNYNLRLRILTLPFRQSVHKSEENVLLSEAELENFHSRYSLQLVRMQEELLSGAGKATAWKGIKVSKVFELNNFYTSFILMEPGAIKPLSKTNHQTHFIIYGKDAIFITVFDSEEQMQAKSANIDETFSLNQGRLYTLKNTMEHPVLIRIWWTVEIDTDQNKSNINKK